MCVGQRGRCETDRLQRKGEADSKKRERPPLKVTVDCYPTTRRLPTRTRAVQHAGNIKKRKKKEKGNPNRRGEKKGDEKKKSAALKRVSKRNRGMPAPREERKNGCPSSLLLSHTLLKGRIKHFSELAATQSERSDSKRLRRGGVTELTAREKATKGPGRLHSAGLSEESSG